MNLIKITIVAAVFGLSLNAFAAVSDISYVTHGSKAGQQPKVGHITQPRWSDLNAVTEKGTSNEVKPIAKATGKYSFGDISAVTHN